MISFQLNVAMPKHAVCVSHQQVFAVVCSCGDVSSLSHVFT